MAKPEWGTKRRCFSCGAAFYDLRKDPIICPRCGTQHQPEALLKPRRGRPEEKVAAVPLPEVAAVVDDEAEAEVVAEEGAEEEDFIEDASELGEDEDDVAEVIEGADEPEGPDER